MTQDHDLLRYAAMMWEADDLVEIRPLPPDLRWFRDWMPPAELARNIPRMAYDNSRGAIISAGVLPRTGRGGKAEDTNGGRVLWADFDNLAPDAALERVRTSGLPPPMLVVSSGHGAHVYWKLDRKLDSQAHTDMRDALKRFCMDHHGLSEHFDPVSMDAARVLRVPGFINHKHPDAPVLCRITYTDEAAVASPEAWGAVLPQPPERTAAPRLQTATANLPDVERRAIAYLAKLPSGISGQRGHNTTYNAARVLAHDFGLSKDRALAILLEHYNPRCEPPWTERELRHKVENAANKPHDRPFGYLRDAVWEPDVDAPQVDLSGILAQASAAGRIVAPPARPGLSPVVEVVETEIEDDDDLPEDDYALVDRLEPLPHELLYAPGFLNDFVEWGMNATFYPNRPMIFASALATLATLTARKIMVDTMTRPNIYTLAIATSGVGKDTGNDLAAAILHHAGMGISVQNRFASGESIEDAFWDTSPAILWLCDEIDGWLRGAKNDTNRVGTAQGKIDAMLSFFTASYKTLHRRQKARPLGSKRRDEPAAQEEIHQPHLSVYGTCTPKGFFSAFNERVAGGGFLGRLLIFDADRRGLGRDPVADITEPPAPVIDAARFWAEHPCGGGNLSSIHPTPRRVEFAADARAFNRENMHWVDGVAYVRHEKVGDDIGCSIWARTCQYAKKLALLYAASANPTNPIIDLAAIRWGWEIARRQSERLILLVSRHSADNPFQELCLKILNRLRSERGSPVTREELLRLTRAKKADFDSAIETLTERREIAAAALPSARRPKLGYRLRVRRKTPS